VQDKGKKEEEEESEKRDERILRKGEKVGRGK